MVVLCCKLQYWIYCDMQWKDDHTHENQLSGLSNVSIFVIHSKW